MSKPLQSYPWYPADWRGSETRLGMTLEERAIYRDLLDHCWIEGSLPSNPRVLASIAGATFEEWERCAAAVLAQFAQGEDGRLHHRKVDERRPEVLKLAELRTEKARRAAGGRWRENAPSNAPSMLQAMPEQCLSDARPMLERCPSPSPSPSPSLNSGVIVDQEQTRARDPDPEPPTTPPPPKGKPRVTTQPGPGGFSRPGPLEFPKGKTQSPDETARREAETALLSIAGDFRLSAPDPALTGRIAAICAQSEIAPKELPALLRPKRDKLRQAKGWGLVLALVEEICRGKPRRPYVNQLGREVYPQ